MTEYFADMTDDSSEYKEDGCDSDELYNADSADLLVQNLIG